MKVQVHIKEKEFEKTVAKKGIAYDKLAKRLKISRVYLSNIKSNKYPDFRPSAKLRDRIMKILDAKFDDIFIFRNSKKKT